MHLWMLPFWSLCSSSIIIAAQLKMALPPSQCLAFSFLSLGLAVIESIRRAIHLCLLPAIKWWDNVIMMRIIYDHPTQHTCTSQLIEYTYVTSHLKIIWASFIINKILFGLFFIHVACREDNVDWACKTVFHIHSTTDLEVKTSFSPLCTKTLIRLGLPSPYSIHKLADIH